MVKDYLNTERAHGCCFCYSGSKHRYAAELKAALPKKENILICDVFAGGGSITTALPISWSVIGNDKDSRIIDIHKDFQDWLEVSSVEEVFTYIKEYCHSQVQSRDDEEGFTSLKENYNTEYNPLALYALATSSNSNYIRFNKSGKFNVSFGKRWLNPSLQKKLYNYLERVKDRDITWESKDFRDYNFSDYDLSIIDPPYAFNGKSTATYNEQGAWQLQDLVCLLGKLDKANEEGSKWVFFNEIVTKGEDNLVIQNWVNKYNVKILRDTLSGCSYQRTKDRSVEVMVTNY